MCSAAPFKPKEQLRMLNPLQPIQYTKAVFNNPSEAFKRSIKGDPMLLSDKSRKAI